MGPYGTIGQWSFFSWLLRRHQPIFFGMNPHWRSISSDFWLNSTVDAISTIFSSMWILIYRTFKYVNPYWPPGRRYQPYSQARESLSTVDIDGIGGESLSTVDIVRDRSTGQLKSNRLIPPKNGLIALWSATNRWYVVKCVSQKQNWSNNKNQWYNFWVTFISKFN